MTNFISSNNEDAITDFRLQVKYLEDGKETFVLTVKAGLIFMEVELKPSDLLNLLQFRDTSLRCRFAPIVMSKRSAAQRNAIQGGFIVLDVDSLAMSTFTEDGFRLEPKDRLKGGLRLK